MKYCIIMQNVYTLGGIQRVIEAYANELIKDNDVTIVMPFLNLKESEKFVKLDERICFCDYNVFHLSNIKNKICNKLITLNKSYPFLEKIFKDEMISNIYFSSFTQDNIVKFINENSFDVVVAAGGDYWSNLLGTISNKINALTIGWQHSTFDSYFQIKGKVNYGLKRYSKNMLNNLDQIWVLNYKDKEKFEKFLNRDSIVLYNPITPSQIKSKLEGKNVCFLGRLARVHKGLDYLIDIIDKTIKLDKEIVFHIAGNGPDRAWFENEIKNRGLMNYVKFYNSVNDVYDYYKGMDLLIQTSTFEGFGMTILEAMTCNLPIIAFHNDGPDEIISNSIDGILINKFDTNEFSQKIVLLLNNKIMSYKLAANALKNVEKFYISEFMEKTKKIIRQGIDGK